MEFPEDLLYTREHSWARQEGERKVVAGITEFIQRELGEISFLELPQENMKVTQTEVIGSVESIKGITEIYSPVSGTIVEINELLLDDPSIINDDSYGDGWIMVIEMEDPSEMDRLMDASEYMALVERELEAITTEDDEEN
jgi:glycine cleavage system H protein